MKIMKKISIAFIVATFLVLPVLSFAEGSFFAPQNGDYTIEATLVGGTGRVTIESPVSLNSKGGSMTASIVLTSPHYEWMQVGDTRYDAIKMPEKSLFNIQVDQFDADLPITALTVAMSEPHEIEYTLRFDSSTIKPLKVASKKSMTLIGGLLITGGMLGLGIIREKRKDAGK